MKKDKIYLLIMLILSPTIVNALSENTNLIISILFMEAFATIFMTIFVLIPLENIFDPMNRHKLFRKLFVSRIIILLIFDFFITTNILVIDILVTIIGGIICSIISKISGSTDKKILNTFKSNLATNNLKENNIEDTSPIVEVDEDYLLDEEEILKELISEEFKAKGEDTTNFTTISLKKKKILLLVVFGIITIINTIMYYFNYPLLLCTTIEVIALIIYYLMYRKLNVTNVVLKQMIKKPDADIDNLINDVIGQKCINPTNNLLKLAIVLLACTILPSLYFINPKIIYTKYDDGYAVFKYTKGFTKRESNITIPETYNGKKVVAIGKSAFENTNIKIINLPEGLKSIKTRAFRNCKDLESIDIPSTVEEIRGRAFENDTRLKSVILHEGLKEIRGGAFKNNTNLYNIELPDSLEYLGGSAFSHCSSLTTITIPKKVIEINGQTFEYCTSLQQINLHDDIISIHGETFVGDINLNNVKLPSKITEIRGNTFEGCTSLTSIIIPEGVTRIGGHAFYGCSSLNYVYIPSTVEEIGSSAFRRCYSLRSVKIPYDAVINERAFKESPTSIERY